MSPDLTKDSAGSAAHRHLEVTWGDLQDPRVIEQAERMRQAQNVPLVRQVGPAPPPSATAWWRGNLATLTLAGLVGGLAGEIVTEVLLRPDSEGSHWYGDSAKSGNVTLSVVLSLVIGMVIASWEGIQSRSRAKVGHQLAIAGPLLLVGGLIGGFISDAIYEPMARSVFRKALEQDTDAAFTAYVRDHLHLPRAIAIGIVGLMCGLALGAASRSVRRALNGALGGAVGGFVGGFLFDYISTSSSSSGVLPRIIAITLTGTVIGAAIGLVEHVAREHWLEIISGGMSGKQFILYGQETIVGSAPAAQIMLVRDPAIAPFHAGLAQRPQGLAIRGLDPRAQLLVNGAPVTDTVLADGAVIQIGSTLLRYRCKSASAGPVGPILG